ncbi:hypothetical protein Q1695_008836 [Nippostrongylus brasiliensis]|nr:hypothetical protein Q1695_008836 [Nippostrongylus brasiliensis]
MQAATQTSSLKLIETALVSVRNRFVKLVSSRLAVDSPESIEVKYRMKSLFDNTVTGGKAVRSTLALDSFRALNPLASTTQLSAMAECASMLEMVQSFYIIIDDIMDESETRRGKPCWYKHPNVGLSAINDALILDAFIEEIMRELYPAHPQVDRLCSSYQNARKTTLLGQLLDTSSVRQPDLFTWDRYEQLVGMKTSHYSVFHPIELAMLVSDRLDNHSLLRRLAYQIGFLFQSQDDILDVFGDPQITGKVGTDIQDGKCTWVSVRAVQKLRGKAEYDAFKEHYGKHDDESVSKIRQMLSDMRIQEEFSNFEKKFCDKVKHDLDQVPEQISAIKPVLLAVLESLRNRKK